MRDKENIKSVAETKPDFMGFIFYSGSKRYVGENFDPFLLSDSRIKPVAVFVNESLDKVLGLVRKYDSLIVQLHGTESPEYCKSIREAGVSVWKTFGMHEKFHWEVLPSYEQHCDYFVFDTSSKEHGGTGKKFDWKLLTGKRFGKPFLLSGGIGPEDVLELKSFNHPEFAGIDINSRFEIEPGLKDPNLVRKFFKDLE